MAPAAGIRVLTVVGARPQFVKAAIVSRALACRGIDEVVVHTGQHYDESLSGQLFRDLGMPAPEYNLGVGSASHAVQTARMLERLEPLLVELAPDWLLVYGDTNSTAAAALAASKLGVPIAHVEAGLRSFNRRMPEEVNRVVTDHLSTLLFAPTPAAVAHLTREGFGPAAVHLVGDVMYDCALAYAGAANNRPVLEDAGLHAGGYVLATVHRAENTFDPARLNAILQGLAAVSRELPVVLPLHPGTEAATRRFGIDIPPAIRVTPPVGYLDMLALERGAAVVATDSGGVQKEAYFQRRPCVVFRAETEWTELVEAGWSVLCEPVSPATIAAAVLGSIGRRGCEAGLYGGGEASARVAAALQGSAA